MANCEYHCQYAEYLNLRIKEELVPGGFPTKRTECQVWDVVQNAAICGSIGNISLEEENLIISTVFCLYPQFEENLKGKLEEKHFIWEKK